MVFLSAVSIIRPYNFVFLCVFARKFYKFKLYLDVLNHSFRNRRANSQLFSYSVIAARVIHKRCRAKHLLCSCRLPGIKSI